MTQDSGEPRPGRHSQARPAEYWDHPLVAGRYFYTLPEPLWDAVLREVGADRFDERLLAMERSLSRSCGDHSLQVGFRAGTPINWMLLRPQRLDAEAQDHIRATTTSSDADAVIAFADQRLDRIKTAQRGYAGWLLTNPQFLDEHDELLRTWREEIRDGGIPQCAPTLTAGSELPPGWQATPAGSDSCPAAVQEFCARWRLADAVAPFVINPMPPQFPALLPRQAEQHARSSGATIYIPDTFPLYSRDELPRMVEDAVRGAGMPEHLEEWSEVVAADNPGKNAIGRYGRLLEIQHYCRILYQRHADALNRRQSRLKEALAVFLHTSTDTIHKDLLSLKQRLGADWTRPVDPLGEPEVL